MATLLTSRPMSVLAVLALGVVCLMPRPSQGHGYLFDPPGRSSMWRPPYNYNTSKNYNDNELNCGGFGVQKSLDMKCGVCGDPYNLPTPRANEVGGKFANATSRPIVARYIQGQTVDFKVLITAYHMGWISFKLCPTNNFGVGATQECLDHNPIAMADGTIEYNLEDTSYSVGWYNVTFTLPADVTCDLCVLQWRYHAGNSWGTDRVTGESGIGYGDQEEFYACADISISASGSPVTGPADEPTTVAPTVAPTAEPTGEPSTPDTCVATGPWEGMSQMDEWCITNCIYSATFFCPQDMCLCS